MNTKIPNEVYQHIFSFIDEIETLHSIILVNRVWCQNSIVQLWRNSIQNVKTIPILLQFIKFDKDLDTTITRFKINDDNENFNTTINVSFDYPCFITHIDFHYLFVSVSEFLQTNEKNILGVEENKTLNIDLVFGCMYIILRLLAFKRANIEWLKIDLLIKNTKRIPDDDEINEERNLDEIDEKGKYDISVKFEKVFLDFLLMDTSKRCIKDLKYLECGKFVEKPQLFAVLSTICKDLNTIVIQDNFSDIIKDPLRFLIQNQHNLENLQIEVLSSMEDDQEAGANITDVISSLDENSTSSLKRISLVDCYVNNEGIFNSLINCKNLEVLELKGLSIPYKNFEILALAEFPKLKCLKFINIFNVVRNFDRIITNPFAEVIQNKMISSNLQELDLGTMYFYNCDLLKAVSENCKNLIKFCGQIEKDEEIPLLFAILKNCTMMKRIQLANLGLYDDDDEIYLDLGFTEEMAKILPLSLNSLLLLHFIDSLDRFKSFFINCVADIKYFGCPLGLPEQHLLDEDINEYEEFIIEWSAEEGKEIVRFDFAHTQHGIIIEIEWE